MAENISCDCKFKINNTRYNSKQKWNSKTCQCECKNDRDCEKDYSWNSSTSICENSNYWKSIVDTSVTQCDEFGFVMNNLSTKTVIAIATKKTNIIATNVTNTASINCYSKKVRCCYILHTFLLVIILLMTITIICYYYAKGKGII